MPFFLLLLLLLPGTVSAHEVLQDHMPFSRWLNAVRRDARGEGVSESVIEDALGGISPDEEVITLDGKQPESQLTLHRYLAKIVTDKRVRQGREMLARHRSLLERIGRKYHVQPRFVVALWGIETNYGGITGNFSTIDALATLAYEGRRTSFFRDELLDALAILQQERMSSANMTGSWAGAMGQCQFMPSTFLKYAVDYNHDGKRDIWNDDADAFASIANYLKSLGWNQRLGWGRAVKLPKHFNRGLTGVAQEKSLLAWRKLGVRKANGAPLPALDIPASLIFAGTGDDAAPYIVYGNYKVLLKWNRSRYFATAVGMLADRIGG
ncbi:MAG: lytic murein transglycosylase [Pseudomonadota bacterium]|nr:lytic murein transglycosylase [Pseudomonadota bacterium]MDE3038131.1 lytic murein transglycosylase [Pseudomonadota bacterium]